MPEDMLKVNEFEHGAGLTGIRPQQATVTYDEQAVSRYQAESAEALIDDTKRLLQMVRHHHRYQVPRLRYLEAYYLGNNVEILQGQRRIEKNKSDHRARHCFAATISDFINTYVLGIPVKIIIEGDDPDRPLTEFEDLIYKFNKENDINAHNSEIGLDQNNLGRAYELLERTQEDQDRIYRLDPTEVFMIHDFTVRSRVIAACRYYQPDKAEDKYTIELYTSNAIYRYRPVPLDSDRALTLNEAPAPHLFNGVPIIEYRSDRHRMGVYERVLPQIDLYDAAVSDTANYMTDFNDAILTIEGRLKADLISQVPKMKDANVLVLIPEDDGQGVGSGLTAKYLTKSYDANGVEAHKSRLKNDIFNLSAVPNLSDEAFSGQRSGEALKYKMFGLEQRKQDKEKFLAKGFRVRYKLLENMKEAVNEYSGEIPTLSFKFTPNLPKAYLEELQTFTNAGGELSQETMLGLLSFIEDVPGEQERIKAEQSENAPEVDEDEYRYDKARRALTGIRQEEGMAGA